MDIINLILLVLLISVGATSVFVQGWTVWWLMKIAKMHDKFFMAQFREEDKDWSKETGIVYMSDEDRYEQERTDANTGSYPQETSFEAVLAQAGINPPRDE